MTSQSTSDKLKAAEPKSSSAECKQGIQVIARSADILRVLSDFPQGLSLAEIADHTDLPRSTVHRIVNALTDEYFVEPAGQDRGFRLGPGLGKLLHKSRKDIVAEVRPHLEELTREFHESSFLGIQSGNSVNTIYRVIPERVLRVDFPVGFSVPMYNTSAGKALLANCSEAELERQLAAGLIPADAAADSEADLRRELHAIRQTGVADDYERHVRGVCAFSVCLNTYMGVFSSGIVLPTARIEGREDAIWAALKAFKVEVENRIGSAAPR